MNQLLEWLAGGDLRSDGAGTEVADLVIKNPSLLDDLLEGLDAPDEVVRGRSAHALERVSRFQPEGLIGRLPQLVRSAKQDPVAMVRWHIAMLLGNLAAYEEQAQVIISTLIDLLQDENAFVRSWAISSLCILGRQYPAESERIVRKIAPLQQDGSIAIRKRAQRGIELLVNDRLPFPAGWVKSEGFKHFSEGSRAAGPD